jgi:TPR repeat protein
LCRGLEAINRKDFKQALNFFDKACKKSNENALLFAGCINLMGFAKNVAPNYIKALSLFQKAASPPLNNHVAQYMTGMILLETYRECRGTAGGKKAKSEAISWFVKSANNGWTLAQTRLAWMCHNNDGILPLDIKEATYWYEQVTNKFRYVQGGDVFNLFGNDKVKVNFEKVNDIVYERARTTCRGCVIDINEMAVCENRYMAKIHQDYIYHDTEFWLAMSNPSLCAPLCQFNLGMIHNQVYQYKFGSVQDAVFKNVEAYKLIEKAALNGNHHAAYVLGVNYEFGTNFVEEQDDDAAFKCYCICINMFSSEALYRNARFAYHEIWYNGRNYAYAWKYLVKVKPVSLENGDARYMMGLIYDHGADAKHGNIKPNYKKAEMYYTEAADAGCSLGSVGVGSIYLWGRTGYQIKYKIASDWFQDAVSIDRCPAAYFYIGYMYLNGLHYKYSLEKALKNFKLALDGGYKYAQEFGIDQVERIKLVKSLKVVLPKEVHQQYNAIINENANTA